MNIARALAADWRRARDVRLRALGDAPDAFGALLADEQKFSDADWQARIAQTDAATFLASIDGADIGITVVAPNEHGDAGLYSVWVAAEARGRGIGDALVAAGVEWARAQGYARITLGVGDYNLPAIRLYERHGFARTGETGTLPPPRTHITEHKRTLALKR